jgi:hypothetical protein
VELGDRSRSIQAQYNKVTAAGELRFNYVVATSIAAAPVT